MINPWIMAELSFASLLSRVAISTAEEPDLFHRKQAGETVLLVCRDALFCDRYRLTPGMRKILVISRMVGVLDLLHIRHFAFEFEWFVADVCKCCCQKQ